MLIDRLFPLPGFEDLAQCPRPKGGVSFDCQAAPTNGGVAAGDGQAA